MDQKWTSNGPRLDQNVPNLSRRRAQILLERLNREEQRRGIIDGNPRCASGATATVPSPTRDPKVGVLGEPAQRDRARQRFASEMAKVFAGGEVSRIDDESHRLELLQAASLPRGPRRKERSSLLCQQLWPHSALAIAREICQDRRMFEESARNHIRL
jgi:hypothetical protein